MTRLKKTVHLLTRLTLSEKARFFYQFAALLNSGITVQQSLNLAGKDCNPSFQNYLQQVSAAVGNSQDLASALALDQRYFNSWTIGLLRLAEYSGSLSQTCEQLATDAEAQAQRERLVRSVQLSTIAIIWSLLILTAAIFNPHPMGLLKPEFWLRSLAIAFLLLGINFFANRYASRRSQQLAINFPVLGKLIQAKSLIHLAQVRLPLTCGVPLLTAVELVREHIPDLGMRANLSRAVRKIRLGQTLSQSLHGKLPAIAMQMIRTGEETGNLDTALHHVAEYYQGELEQRLHGLQTKLRTLSVSAIAALIALVGIQSLRTLLNSLPN